MKPAVVEGEEIVVFNLGGRFYALCDLCPHGSFRFSRGVVLGDAVMCPGHRWTFDVRSGRCRTTEWEPAARYRVRVREDGTVVVALPVKE